MNFIDLTQTITNAMPIYPGDLPVNLTRYRNLDPNGYVAHKLDCGLHIGTHIDAPMHMIRDDRLISDFDVNCFAGTGVLLDVRGENPIGMKARYEELVSEGDVVLLYTGHCKHFLTDRYYHDYPAITDELAEFLAARQIKMLGMDMPSPDYPPFAAHKLMFAKGIIMLENLTNLQALAGADKFEVMAFPPKIEADGCFTRAVARVIS